MLQLLFGKVPTCISQFGNEWKAPADWPLVPRLSPAVAKLAARVRQDDMKQQPCLPPARVAARSLIPLARQQNLPVAKAFRELPLIKSLRDSAIRIRSDARVITGHKLSDSIRSVDQLE